MPAQESEPKDAGGKKVSELVSPDTIITESGEVSGTLLYVDSMPAFPEGENAGHYMPVKLAEKYAGKDITVKGKKTATAQDLDWLLYVADTSSKFTFETVEDGVFLTLTFTSTVLMDKAGRIMRPLAAATAKKSSFSKAKAASYLDDL